ncbi:MAG TPA: hypothetical protein VJZ76_19595 [Thermoanaerobaculia bacterium]|nr:hypothetical protein [Thermoanaerobaculia bacterium]
MRTFVAAVALLTSLAAAAQNISNEIVSDPLPQNLAPLNLTVPAVSLAKDHHGAAIAWSMAAAGGVDRIYVARLDGGGRLVGTPHEIPPSIAKSATHEAYPALAPAPDGEGVWLAWTDIDHDVAVSRTVVARLDANLESSTPQWVTGGNTLPTAPPIVRTKGDTSWIAVNGFVWTLSSDGRLGTPLLGVAASDMTVGINLPQVIGGRRIRNTSNACFPNCRDTYSVDFVSLFTVTKFNMQSFLSDLQPAIDSNGAGDILVVFFRGDESSGGTVEATRFPASEVTRFDQFLAQSRTIGTFPADGGGTRPSVANDGTRWVIVWRARTAPGNHDIAGAVLDADGKVTPLSIATSAADELDPAVLALGDGSFLVAYAKVFNGERRIAGRFLSFGRRRAAR